MEFRNHQARLRHQYRNLAGGNPFAALLLGVVFLILLVPMLLLLVLIGAVILLPAIGRLALARLSGNSAATPRTSRTPPRTGTHAPSGSPGAGTVLDAEATVRTKPD